MKLLSFFIAFSLIVLPGFAFAQADPGELKASGQIKFSKGYIDDEFAVSNDGAYLGYVSVVANGKATLHIRLLKSGVEKTVEITKITNEPKFLKFIPKANLLAVAYAKKKYFNVTFFNLKGENKGTINGISDMVCKIGKIITYRRYSGNGMQIHRVNIYASSKLTKPEKALSIRGDIRGRVIIKPDSFDIAYFTPDYLKVIVKIIGRYDKKTDSKTPDLMGIYDLETKKITKGKAISNNAKWDKEVYTYHRLEGYSNILNLKGVASVTGINGIFRISTQPGKWLNVKPSFNLGRFDFSTLNQVKRADKSGFIWFSMMIDPQNPVTLKKLKSEKRYLHIFKINPKTGSATDTARLKAKSGLVKWKKGANTIAVMRLHKNWTVGSEILEIYKAK